ncbi:cation:proton antiporter [Methanofollis sp. UBA420]|jgi:Kef-type K+ transport system membrane component KefB|uniref:cation:proton antiporter n=1 Tax=Methanofollis sp. UBA420 TaxID=1915514 RepID=UPI00316AD2C2
MDPLLQVILVLVVAKVFGEIVERTGYPALIGEIGAGVLLGPSVLGLVAYGGAIEFFADIGIIALLFISGVQMNMKSFAASEKAAVSTALAGVGVPLALGILLGVFAGFSPVETLFVGIALSITSIGIAVRALIDLRRLDTPSGTTITGAAVIDDILGIVLLAVLTAVASGSGGAVVYTVAAGAAFILGSIFIGKRLLPYILVRARQSRTHEMPYSAAIAVALLMGWLSNLAGLHYAIGAFFAGLLLGDQIRNDRELFDGLADFAFGFFVTIFFASVGLLFEAGPEIVLSPLVLPLVAVAFAGKILGGYLGALPFLAHRAEALIVGIGLCPRGEITLVVAKVALLGGLITRPLFSAFMVTVIVTVVVTPALMAAAYRRWLPTGGRPP